MTLGCVNCWQYACVDYLCWHQMYSNINAYRYLSTMSTVFCRITLSSHDAHMRMCACACACMRVCIYILYRLLLLLCWQTSISIDIAIHLMSTMEVNSMSTWLVILFTWLSFNWLRCWHRMYHYTNDCVRVAWCPKIKRTFVVCALCYALWVC